ncbi:MAG: adenosylmethionine decarboxylase [Ktedonobacterales bacterium]
MFGPHLIIDGSRCNTQKLADRILVEQVLNDYPTAIGMTKIGGPYMFEYQAPDPAYSGVSGLVVIAESHIAIHTFPELDYFTMDIFSCKNFDHELAIEYIKKAFDVQEMDRMLVQRGLSFRGPHHGKNGATDELIAAADARLAAGIISKETALPDEGAATQGGVVDERLAALARHEQQAAESGASGRMIWPQYGVTPDVGTYGAEAHQSVASGEPGVRGGAQVIALTHEVATLTTSDGRQLAATEPMQVNPTASISGLLDKLTHSGGQGRALGRALATWERAARADDTLIALTLSAPVIADGLRETLACALDRHYVDVVVASADDLFADVAEALGHAHYADGDVSRLSAQGRAATLTFIIDFLADTLAHLNDLLAEQGSARQGVTTISGSELWQRLGETLHMHAPRKGLLQSAAQAGIPVIAPDVTASVFGAALLAVRGQGATLAIDTTADLATLARLLGERPSLCVIRSGEGSCDALLTQAGEIAPTLGYAAPTLAGRITLGGILANDGAQPHLVNVAADASLALPLLVTGLAQRLPSGRQIAPTRTPPETAPETASQTASQATTQTAPERTAEPALA